MVFLQLDEDIKSRINMINKNYRMGSNWDLILILSLALLSFYLNSCTVKSVPKQTHNEIPDKTVLTDGRFSSNVEEIQTFQGEDTVVGYPIESKGFPKKRYELENRTSVDYSFRSTGIPIKLNQLENRIVVGYPIESKGFPKKRNE